MESGVALEAVWAALLVHQLVHEAHVLLIELDHVVGWLDVVFTWVFSTPTKVAVLFRCDISVFGLTIELVVACDAVQPAQFLGLLVVLKLQGGLRC